MAQIEQSSGGKQKKGAQKKMSIHVDFTPMVDMNMLLITFFMLCTTMIKSQTLQIVLPTNEDVKKEQQSQAKQSEAITMILDTEYNGDKPAVNAETGKPFTISTIMKVSPILRSRLRNICRKSSLSVT